MILLAVVAALFGLIVGSFLNVVIHRVPLRQSIVWPRPHCPTCGAPTKSFDNVPVLSYLLLRGKCRHCKARVSPRYPLVEGLTGFLFGLAVYEFGLSLALVPALVFIAVLIALAGTDLEHRLLPSAIVFPATLVDWCSRSPWTRPAGGFTSSRPWRSRPGCSRWSSATRAAWGWVT